MDSQPVISVRGEARLEVEPEITLLGVTVMAQDKDRRRALKLLAGRTRAVADLIRGYEEAVEKLESGVLAGSLWPEAIKIIHMASVGRGT